MVLRLRACINLRYTAALAAALHVILGYGLASAQTVVVRRAPANSTIEFVLNGSVTATATAGADGLATLTATTGAIPDRETVDAMVWVDECGSRRRVVVMNRVQQPPPADGCRRSQIPGLFRLQRITSFLVDVETATPTVLLRQGRLPEDWLKPPVASVAGEPRISIVPRGLILFAGGENGNFGSVLEPACGDVTNCTDTGRAFSFTGGVSYWFSQYVGAEASYVRPSQLDTDGSGDRFRFDTELDGGLMVFAGKVGFPVGRVRIFGTAGMDYHRATFTTRQTIDDIPATVPIPGGTSTLQWRTQGWAPAFGGGTEIWVTGSIAIYGEFSRFGLKGTEDGPGEAETDETITAFIVGGRYRLGGR